MNMMTVWEIAFGVAIGQILLAFFLMLLKDITRLIGGKRND